MSSNLDSNCIHSFGNKVSTFCGSSNDTDFSILGALVHGDFIVGASNDTDD